MRIRLWLLVSLWSALVGGLSGYLVIHFYVPRLVGRLVGGLLLLAQREIEHTAAAANAQTKPAKMTPPPGSNYFYGSWEPRRRM